MEQGFYKIIWFFGYFFGSFPWRVNAFIFKKTYTKPSAVKIKT
jgi:hypothetical protein